jgi:ferredoxin
MYRRMTVTAAAMAVLVGLAGGCLSETDDYVPMQSFSSALSVETGPTASSDVHYPGEYSAFELSWAAAEEADYYIVRSSTEPITPDNWSRALPVDTVTGSTDSVLVHLQPEVFENACIGCGQCAEICPRGAITMVEGRAVISTSGPDSCTACGECVRVCPVSAIADNAMDRAYYFAVRAYSEAGVPSERIATSPHSYRMVYRNNRDLGYPEDIFSRCGRCGEGCYILVDTYGPGCPVDAVYFDEEGWIYIDTTLCISCGQCFIQCWRDSPGYGSIWHMVQEAE